MNQQLEFTHGGVRYTARMENDFVRVVVNGKSLFVVKIDDSFFAPSDIGRLKQLLEIYLKGFNDGSSR